MTPSNTLPTAPGFYWWRQHPQAIFSMVEVRQFGSELSAYDVQTGLLNGHTLSVWQDLAQKDGRPIGEWVAVPRPSEIPTPASPLQRQEGGSHYKDMAIQPMVFITRNNLGFLEGSVIKRVCRHRRKGKAEDIRKGIHELESILEMEYGEHINRA